MQISPSHRDDGGRRFGPAISCWCAARAGGSSQVRAYDGLPGRHAVRPGAAAARSSSAASSLPFDRIEPIARPSRPRDRAARSRWRRACRALIAADGPPGSLRAARAARIDLLPHQLEPAIAILRGLGTRLLLADEVGLGKTIQAGLVAPSCSRAASIERVLVLTPPGLRDQWLQELADRFAIDATGVDGHVLRRLAATLPIGVNPWRTLTTAVASIDYVKRPEVFPAVGVVPVGSGHRRRSARLRGRLGSARRGARARGARRLRAAAERDAAQRRSRVVRVAVRDRRVGAGRVRRCSSSAGRAPDAGIGTARRVHIVRVRPSGDEARMHALLTRYTRCGARGRTRARRRRAGSRCRCSTSARCRAPGRWRARSSDGSRRCPPKAETVADADGAAARRSAGRADRGRRGARRGRPISGCRIRRANGGC